MKREEKIETIWHDARDIRELGGESYELIKHGGPNDLMIVRDAPRPYVIKIPHDDPYGNEKRSSHGEFETNTLLMRIADSAPCQIASPLIFTEDPLYATYDYLEGVSLNSIKKPFTTDEQQRIGAKVGQFVAWMGREFTQDMLNERSYRPAPHTIDKAQRNIGENIDLLHKLGLKSLESATRELTIYREANLEGLMESPIIGHSDLHGGNLLFNDNHDVTGIIDFAFTARSSVARELRNLFVVGPEALEASIEAYRDESNQDISVDFVYYWSRVRWVIMCISNIKRHRAVPSDAERLLSIAYPSTDWSELQRWNESLSDTAS